MQRTQPSAVHKHITSHYEDRLYREANVTRLTPTGDRVEFRTRTECASARYRGVPGGLTLKSLTVDGSLERFRQEEKAENQSRARHDDGIPKSVVDIAGRSHHGEGSGREEPSEPAIADVIRQRHGGVADARRKQFNQERGNRSVH